MTHVLDPTVPPIAVRPTSPLTTTPARGPERRRSLPWRWLVVLATGLALFGAVSRVLVTTHDPLYLPCLLLLGAALVPATLTTLVTETERSSRVTLAQILTTAVLGGVAGTVLAGLFEFDAQRTLGSLPFVMIGLIEESAKLAIPIALFSWGRSRGRAMDGLVLGVAAGSGFAALETTGYAFVALLEAHGQLQPVEHLILTRALASLGGHAAWTGLAAAAWFGIGNTRRRWVGWARFITTFTGVVCLHALWDATAASGLYRYVAALSFALLVATVAWLRFRAARPTAYGCAVVGGGSST